MPDTFTAHFNFTKPEVGASRDAWGTKDNANWDAVDAALQKIKDDTAAAIAAIQTIPVGTIADFATFPVPAGWIRCNGAILSRAAYPALYAAIGTTYGTGFGDGLTFSVPDVRGLFRRGLDEGRGIDPNRNYGSIQWSQNLSHAHVPTNSGAFITGYGQGLGRAFVASGDYLQIDNMTYSGGSEARPTNMAFPACIKY